AAGELASEVPAPLLQPREHFIGLPDHAFRAILEADEKVFLHRKRRKDVTRLRHVTKAEQGAGSSSLSGAIAIPEADIAAVAARLSGYRGKQAGLAHAVATKHSQPRSGRHGEGNILDRPRRSIAG